MGFRISPYKIIRLVAIIAVLSYGFVEISEFRKKKTKETEKVEKTLDIRKKDFYNSQEEKQKILNQGNETTIASNGDGKSETGQPTVTVKISEANKESQKTDEVQQEKADKEKAAVLKKAQEQKKAEEEAQRKIVDQIAQQKKAAAEKKAREAEEIAAAKKAKEQKEAATREAERKAKEQKEAAAREAEKKAKGKAQVQQAQKKPAETKKISKKYIQVATLGSEAAAKSAVSKLGGNFNYQKISGKGKTLYVVVSVSTDNPSTLSSLENQVKTKLPSTKYIVRSAGK
ncbi:hypothetical protein [Leptotrichia sp. oral taxon 212]|jgi:putative tolA protein|uniref:hypothetical protein n=1 Tax=Leptotrichia sp. oral taxon 212 TaxID=712357 RepID=UPI0006A95541|nr:hypothetical protein [Leptotrichia sp. oral taxon 212]ALA95271.1 hypothetical protein AMK43_03795 [Leptotrichia sp. oral taxon 212]